MQWAFDDPPNLAVFTSASVLRKEDWIHLVIHAGDDESIWWEFHPYKAPLGECEATVAGLNAIVAIDPTVAELHDLPLGWCAWRSRSDSRWLRKRIAPQ